MRAITCRLRLILTSSALPEVIDRYLVKCVYLNLCSMSLDRQNSQPFAQFCYKSVPSCDTWDHSNRKRSLTTLFYFILSTENRTGKRVGKTPVFQLEESIENRGFSKSEASDILRGITIKKHPLLVGVFLLTNEVSWSSIQATVV